VGAAAELAAAVSPRTKLLVVNTPQNVPGKVWTMGELEAIADLAKRHDFLVVADQARAPPPPLPGPRGPSPAGRPLPSTQPAPPQSHGDSEEINERQPPYTHSPRWVT